MAFEEKFPTEDGKIRIKKQKQFII
jgi:hypothetical protein